MMEENMLCLVDRPANEVIELYINDRISYTALSCYMSYNGFSLQQDFDWNRIYSMHLAKMLEKRKKLLVTC